ncbi:MAG: hypothetical protein WCT19_03025 [Candidatus Paceibacterota bacterium]|jgi:predicted membrane protein
MKSRFIFGIILVIIGISALLDLSFFKLFFAIIIILLGVRLISGKWSRISPESASVSNEDFLNEVLIFSPVNKVLKSEKFKGGKAVLVFAGGQIDLKDVKSADGTIYLELTSVFSGLKLIVPKDWKVVSEGSAIFGGYNNKTESGSGTVLNIKGTAVFGGVEIMNPKTD